MSLFDPFQCFPLIRGCLAAACVITLQVLVPSPPSQWPLQVNAYKHGSLLMVQTWKLLMVRYHHLYYCRSSVLLLMCYVVYDYYCKGHGHQRPITKHRAKQVCMLLLPFMHPLALSAQGTTRATNITTNTNLCTLR